MKYIVLISHLCFALLMFGQKADIFIEVSETEVSVGQNISISITTSLNGNIEFQFPNHFISRLKLLEERKAVPKKTKAITSQLKLTKSC